MSFKGILSFSLCCIMLIACTKQTVSPELFGSIEGRVLDTDTEEGISGANITTNPATNSILANPDGTFHLEEVPTGQYSVTANKSGYKSQSVNVRVRENKVASAQIYLDSEANNGDRFLMAEVITWAETNSGDSTFAEVEYRVSNTSDNIHIREYEIYFDIHTPSEIFVREEADTALSVGESNIGNFTKYVRQSNIDSVVVSGTWTSN